MPRSSMKICRVLGLSLVIAWACLSGPSATAQVAATPVFPDDSPLAIETFQRLGTLVQGENYSQVVRELQTLLNEVPMKVVRDGVDPDLFRSIREAVHEILHQSPPLLERYRVIEGPRAEEDLAAGRADAVELSRLYTPAGFDAALRVAQSHLEASRFESAWRTLKQLEHHPDRADQARARSLIAAGVLVAAYLPESDAAATIARWEKEAGVAATPIEPIERPEWVSRPVYSLDTPITALGDTKVPAEPLWAAPLWGLPASGGDVMPENIDAMSQMGLWVIPTIRGDTVYINDGASVTARDRYTLRPRWQARPHVAGLIEYDMPRREFTGRAMGPEVADTTTVTLAGRTLIATTGLSRGSEREGDPRTHAIDVESGRVLWSTDVGRCHPQLDGAVVRGPARVHGNLVIVAARRPLQGQRLTALYVAALGLDDGAPRWVRLVASSGASLGDDSGRRSADALSMSQGRVFVTDPMGVAAAIDAGSGRPIWVRRFSTSDEAFVVSGGRRHYEWGGLVPHGELVSMITPDNASVVSIQADRGTIFASRPASTMGNPNYLLSVGTLIVGVARAQLATVPADQVGAGPVEASAMLDPSAIRGRVVQAGDHLMVPIGDGALIIDPTRLSETDQRYEIRSAGNIIPLPDQWLVFSGTQGGQIASHLTWESASSVLEARIKADPADPDPSITLAEMAYRAEAWDRVGPASEGALRAIDKADPDQMRSARRRLFASLREMAERSLGTRDVAIAPELANPSGDPARAGMLEAILKHMQRAATGHEERAAQALLEGRWHETGSRWIKAIDAYQRVLLDAGMSRAPWRSAGFVARADLEATRRVRTIVRREGLGVYAAFEAEAQQAAARAATMTAQELEVLARRYPSATLTPTWWSRVAALLGDAKAALALSALDEALASAELLTDAGAWPAPADDPLGSIAGQLIDALGRADQPFAAVQLVDRLNASRPGLRVVSAGAPIDLASLKAALETKLASDVRLPIIGDSLQSDAQVLDGWTLMTPISTSTRAAEHVMLESRQRGEVALWSAVASQGGREESVPIGPQHLRKLWSREIVPSQGPRLLAQTPLAVFLAWERQDRWPSIERVNAIDGRTVFETQHFGQLIAGLPQPENAPNAGLVRPGDVLVTIDERAIVLIERGGRGGAFDATDGRVLWSIASEVGIVGDIASGAGVVAIAGEQRANEPAARGSKAVIALHDQRTGQTLGSIDAGGSIRWVRITPSGVLIVGTDRAVQAYDLSDRTQRWSITRAPANDTLEAWPIGDLVYLLDTQRSLWRVPVATGLRTNERLETYERLVQEGPIIATALGEGRAAFSTSAGVCVFDRAGKLVGIDGMGSETLLPPLATRDRFVAIETGERALPDGRIGYEVLMPDSPSCLLREHPQVLVLEDRPRRGAVLDGRVIVTAGAHTYVFRTTPASAANVPAANRASPAK